MNRFTTLAAAAAAVIAGASAAQAAQTAFSLQVSGSSAVGANFNVPRLTVTNLSDNGALLNAFSLTIGDTAFNFDYAQSLTAPAGGASTIVTGDLANGGARTDLLSFTFTSFDGGDFVTWLSDIDSDAGNSTEDFRTVMFNNGGAGIPNAQATATFSNGITLQGSFGSGLGTQTTYTLTQIQTEDTELSDVPVPAALPLMAVALGAMGVAASRRKR
ncbi:VPLPA-CTERM sorting domain-containing protein [Rhodovulum sp. DZ06]|uniref:VPLPA-CTERM sorting domain-containing protein n=1 Tax=Rhodovulum sp. DZ06 TaxID=3425126 RepID=UPI003D34EEFD